MSTTNDEIAPVPSESETTTTETNDTDTETSNSHTTENSPKVNGVHVAVVDEDAPLAPQMPLQEPIVPLFVTLAMEAPQQAEAQRTAAAATAHAQAQLQATSSSSPKSNADPPSTSPTSVSGAANGTPTNTNSAPSTISETAEKSSIFSKKASYFTSFFNKKEEKKETRPNPPTTTTPSSSEALSPTSAAAAYSAALAVDSPIPSPVAETETQKLVETMKPETDKQTQKKSLFGSFFNKSQKEEQAKQQEREIAANPLPFYLQNLRKILQRHESNVTKLLALKKKYEMQSVEEIQQWNSYSISSLASIAASYYHTHILHVSTLLELESRYLENSTLHYQISVEVAEGKKPREEIQNQMLEDGQLRSLESTEKLFWPPNAEETKSLCKSLYEQVEKMDLTYTEMKKKALRRESLQDRKKRLLDIIRRGYDTRDTQPADSFHHHRWNTRSQVAYNNMMSDQRGAEGLLMKRLVEVSAAHPDRITPATVKNFVDVLTQQILKTYTIEDRVIPCLKLYSDRLIFSRIQKYIPTLIPEDEKEKDISLAKRLPWMRTIPPAELDLSEEIIPPGFVHRAYEPLFTPDGTYVEEKSEEEKEKSSQLATPNSSDTTGRHGLHVSIQEPSSERDSAVTSNTELASPTSPTSVGGMTSETPVSRPLDMLTEFPLTNKFHDDENGPPPMVPADFPYAEAINILSQINYETVPADIFMLILRGVRQLFQTAKHYMKLNLGLHPEILTQPPRKFSEVQRKYSKTAEDAINAFYSVPNSLNHPSTTHASSDSEASISDASVSTSEVSTTLPTDQVESQVSTETPASDIDAATPPQAQPSDPVNPADISEDSLQLNADMLFPLMVWLTIHANIPTFNSKIGIMDRFLAQDLKQFGEAGMCVSLVEAAVSYLNELTPETLERKRHHILDAEPLPQESTATIAADSAQPSISNPVNAD